MQKKYLLSLTLFIVCNFGYTKISYAKNNTYCNDKYSYCLDYSDMFIPQGEPDAHDGQKFLSRDKKSELSVWGGFNIQEKNINEMYKEYSQGKNITYKSISKNSFTISGIEKDKIFYQRAFINSDTFNSYYLVYPKSQKTSFDKIISKLNIYFSR